MSTTHGYQALTAERYIKEAELCRIAERHEVNPDLKAVLLRRASLAVQLASVCATLEAAGLRPTEFQASE